MRRRLGRIHITWWNTYRYLRDYYWPRMRQRNPIHPRAVTYEWAIKKVVKRACRPEIRRDLSKRMRRGYPIIKRSMVQRRPAR